MKEINESYQIIDFEIYNTTRDGRKERIVLAININHPGMFVTWDGSITSLDNGDTKKDFYWGHYFDNEAKARADYHRRLMERYEG